MTDDEIREVFAEFTRIGVDLAQPPGLAIGTGFRDGELLPWLRALSDGIGHDAFVARLTEHVSSAEPNVAAQLPRGDGSTPGKPHRLWPTVEQMNLAIDVLSREWDPLAARLGDLTSETVMHHAHNALTRILHGGDADRLERSIASQLGTIEQEVFGVRPSPREQRRYLARRLIRVVVENPGSPHDEDPFEAMMRAADASMEIARSEGRLKETRTATGSSVKVCFGPHADDPPAYDPSATCSECGAVGTVAVVGRAIEPKYSRYCPECWRNLRGKYWAHRGGASLANWDAEDASSPEAVIAALDGMSEQVRFEARERVRMVGSAMWEDVGPMIESQLPPDRNESEADHARRLRRLAEDLGARRGSMYGDMPPAIERFIQEYQRRDEPSAPGTP